MCERLLVLGATARAAAMSAHRAGFQPLAADLFGDTDLRACCPAIRVRDYPRGLVAAAAAFPVCPWIYSGALENHPEVIDAIRCQRPLLGNPSEVVRAIRDPWALADALLSEGFRYPRICRDGASVPPGEWLRKPLCSAGGRGISRRRRGVAGRYEWETESAAHSCEGAGEGGRPPAVRTVQDAYYLQEWVAGVPLGAIYVACRGRATLLGVTRQLIGSRWAGARDWSYAGSLGPLELTRREEDELIRLGTSLAARFSLRGIFGVDAVLNDRGIWILEVNPRYTASVEIVERLFDVHAVSWHVAACRDQILPERHLRNSSDCWGKAIVFAKQRVTVASCFRERARCAEAMAGWPLYGDTPGDGESIDAGQPITTVFAAGTSLDEVDRGLRSRVRDVRLALGDLVGE